MSKVIENNTEVLNAVRKYFDGDLTWSVAIEALAVWLETQNISINGRDLLKLVQEHADEFEVNKVQNNIIMIKLKKVVAPAINESSGGNGSYIKDMIELQQAEFFGNDINFVNSYIQENVDSELNTVNLFYEGIINDSSTNPLKQAPSPISSTTQDKLIEQTSPKNVVRESKALDCAKKYLDLYLVDSIFELEKHMKLMGVINGSEFQDFSRENAEIFQIFSERGITCIKLSNPSIKMTEHSTTMIERRFSQTERLTKDYLTRHGGIEGVTSTELNIYLRGIEGSITDELVEFLKSCKDSFECILKDEMYYIKMVPQPSKPIISALPNISRGKNKPSKTYVLQLIREFLVKHTITSITEIEEHLKAYPTLSILAVDEFVNSHANEFKFKRINGELYLRLKPTDPNIISYIRKYLLEFGKVRLSVIGDHLKRQDMCPRNRLKDFLHPFPDFRLTVEQSDTYVQSYDIDIARHLRQFLKGKGEVLISSVRDHLRKTNMYPNCKLIEFLENYPEFILSQGPIDILVRYSSVPNEILPKDFVCKYVMFEGGRVPLRVLVSHLNWNGTFPEFKLVELIDNSVEFVLQTFGNEQCVIINHKDKPSTNVMVNNDLNDAQKLDLADQEKSSLEKSVIDETTKSTESDISPQTHISSTTSSEGRSTPQSPVLFDPLISTKVQFTKPSQFESKTPTSPQFEPKTPTSPQFEPKTPTSPQFEPKTPTSPQFEPKTPTSPQFEPKTPTSPQFEPKTPTSPQFEPKTPTSPQFEPKTPTSPQFEPKTPTSPQSDSALSSTNAQNVKISQSETSQVVNEQISKPSLSEPLIQPKEIRDTANDIQELIVRDESFIGDISYRNHLFCHSLLETNRDLFNNYTSLGILESLPNEIVYLNGNYPFSTIITGLPNSGASQTKNTILEGFLIKNTRLGRLSSPFSALIFRYDNSVMALPCESALVATSAKHSGAFDQDTRAEKVVVLVTPSNYRNMLRLYANIDNCEVIPLLFSENDLCGDDIKLWIDIEGDAQIHEQVKELVNEILYYHTNDQFNYAEFCIQLYDGCINSPRMKTFLNTRLGKLDSFVVERLKESLQNKSFSDKFIPLKELVRSGVVVVVDLSDPLLCAKMASELFNIILGIHIRNDLKSSVTNETESHVRKLVVLDEAHKFLVANTSLATTVHHLQSYPQHHNMNLIMTTYEPTLIPIPILLQTNVLLLHRFSSPLWSQFLLQHLPFPEGNSEKLLSKVMRLRVGRMIIFCPYDDNDFNLTMNYNNGREEKNGSNYFNSQDSSSHVVILRKRITFT